jgi:hypothetical protein
MHVKYIRDPQASGRARCSDGVVFVDAVDMKEIRICRTRQNYPSQSRCERVTVWYEVPGHDEVHRRVKLLL